MRTLLCAVAFAAWFGTTAALAADIEFECDETMFEQPAPVNQDITYRFTIEGRPNFDSPLYEGLFPMTLELFQASGRQLNVPTELNFAVPVIPGDRPTIEQQEVVPAGMVIASSDDVWRRFQTSDFFSLYNSPLYDCLWPMTVDAFRAGDDQDLDEAVPGMVIAANDMHPLRNSLWKATRERFAEMEAVHTFTFGGIAFSR